MCLQGTACPKSSTYILMNGSMDEERVCKIQPLGVNCYATFIIDFDSVDIADLKGDDVGSWKGTGTRGSYFKMDEYNIPEFVKGMPRSHSCFIIVCHYFAHETYSKFRRYIIKI